MHLTEARQQTEPRARLPESAVRIVSANYRLQRDDHMVWVDASLHDVVIHLPPPAIAHDPATRRGRTFVIRKVSGEHRVLLPDADAPTGYAIEALDDSVVVISDGSAWWAIARF